MTIKSAETNEKNILSGGILNLEGSLIVMNDPENKILVELLCNNDKAFSVEWGFEDPNNDNALMIEAYNDGIVKLGKRNDPLAKYWYQYQNYVITSDNSDNTTAISNINNFKTAILFNPSGVGGDDYIIVAKVKNSEGKVIKTVRSQILRVVRKIQFDKLYHMKGVRSLLQYASSENIQKYFNKAFIIYEAPANSIELEDRLSVKYLAQYDRNNEVTHEYKWTDIAAPVDYNPPIRKSNGNIVYTEKLSEEEKLNCNSQSIMDKADSWKKRLLRLKKECTENWKNDINLANAIVSVNRYHIMYGNDNDPDAFYNPFQPCSSVPITINGFTTYAGSGLWITAPVGGMNLNNGITIILEWITGDEDITNVIAHEIAHTTNDFVNGRPIMYRDEFGPGDHSQTNGEGLMEPKPFRYGKIIDFSKEEIKILRGYKK
ncbi:hypothetical protein [Tenuifilum thalassicum]|uniref:Uncharacterized protein n=1 Tax=Tenuifilum thalassicum TaxID=2590900 RepID=A0A7D4BE15_9BACT|nr:hypothetical protein [Tenuifilum thalassicum]QKG80283.1 hypothetical protein FHG85_08425 [Tenuifilum thalassicum]